MFDGVITIAKSYYLALKYERCRAINAKVALTNFLFWLTAELSRVRQVGLKDYLRLVRLEVVCAKAGLGFARDSAAKGPPWQIPTRFIGLAVTDMPHHSLVEPQELLRTINFGNGDAVDALAHFLSDPEAFWRKSGLSCIHGPASNPSSGVRIAVCLHLFYPEMWPELNAALDSISEPFDLYITVPGYTCTPELHRIALDRPGTHFFASDNRGRDVLPFLKLLRWGYFDCYDVVCKLHSKRSPHIQDGQRWRKELLSSLLGSKEAVAYLINRFRSGKNIGIIGSGLSRILPGERAHLGCNQSWLNTLSFRVGLPESSIQEPFFAGTMFWFRPSAFESLRTLKISDSEFPLEMGQTDGTPAHAIERLIWPLVKKSQFNVEADMQSYSIPSADRE